jgi:hypothetical protein
VKTEKLLELVHEFRGIDYTDSFHAREKSEIRYSEILESIATVAAERRQLAKYCVIVTAVCENGEWRKKVWCTVCQSQIEYLFLVGPNPEKLIHREDCLVAKVEAEG